MNPMEVKLRRAELSLSYLNSLIELNKNFSGFENEINKCIEAINDDLQITRDYNGKTINKSLLPVKYVRSRSSRT
ncbi:hypothetical protein D8Z77_02090 [Brevibacillus laterosporus]|nr:hypothetical protein D8Z77_02090 [Brevibacillus laterosporus]